MGGKVFQKMKVSVKKLFGLLGILLSAVALQAQTLRLQLMDKNNGETIPATWLYPVFLFVFAPACHNNRFFLS